MVFDAAQVCAFVGAPLTIRQWSSLHDLAREHDGTIRVSRHASLAAPQGAARLGGQGVRALLRPVGLAVDQERLQRAESFATA